MASYTIQPIGRSTHTARVDDYVYADDGHEEFQMRAASKMIMWQLECVVLDPGPHRVLPEDCALGEWFVIMQHQSAKYLQKQEKSMRRHDRDAEAKTNYRIVILQTNKLLASRYQGRKRTVWDDYEPQLPGDDGEEAPTGLSLDDLVFGDDED